MECRSCGKELSEGTAFCPYCGARQVKPPRVCPSCGRQVEDGMVFCPDCGKRVDESPAAGESVQADETTAVETAEVEPAAVETGEAEAAYRAVAFDVVIDGAANWESLVAFVQAELRLEVETAKILCERLPLTLKRGADESEAKRLIESARGRGISVSANPSEVAQKQSLTVAESSAPAVVYSAPPVSGDFSARAAVKQERSAAADEPEEITAEETTNATRRTLFVSQIVVVAGCALGILAVLLGLLLPTINGYSLLAYAIEMLKIYSDLSLLDDGIGTLYLIGGLYILLACGMLLVVSIRPIKQSIQPIRRLIKFDEYCKIEFASTPSERATREAGAKVKAFKRYGDVYMFVFSIVYVIGYKFMAKYMDQLAYMTSGIWLESEIALSLTGLIAALVLCVAGLAVRKIGDGMRKKALKISLF